MAIGIQCCRHCVPPKRHVGCHSKCEEYAKEKAQFEIDKEKVKANDSPKITTFDLNRVAFFNYRLSNRKNRRRR